MARVQELMAGLDEPRPLPAEMRARLEASLVFATVEVTEENLAAIVDRPKDLPEGLRARLEALLVRRQSVPRADSARIWQALGAAAAAVIVLVAVLIALPNRSADQKPGTSPGAVQTITTPPTVTSPTPATTTPPKKQAVLGKSFRQTPPATVRRGSTSVAISQPEAVPGEGAAPGSPVGSRTAARSAASAPSGGSLLDSVSSIVSRLLAVLTGPAPSGTSKGAAAQLPADDASLVGSLINVIAPQPAPAAGKATPARTSSASRQSAPKTRTSKSAAPKSAAPAPARKKAPAPIPLLSAVTDVVTKTVDAVVPVVGSLL